MKLKTFFDTEFKVFSNLDNVRSIPSVIDGFKDSQRKAVYGMIEHGTSEIKVAQCASKFALITHYAHGETSMADTIVGLAQDYPGSNNVNLFEPIGQFGTILSSESSSHRYIFTKPSDNLRRYIKQDDDCILTYRYEDGDRAEPENFFPVLPMWILNGAMGIGTGHSVKILPRDPAKVSALVERLLSGDKPQNRTINRLLRPTFLGWKGEVLDGDEQGKYELHGVLEVVNTTTIRVTELPVGYGVDKFKAILVDLMDKGKVKDFDNNSTEQGFDFEIKVPRDVGKLDADELKKLFKLISRQSENVTMWNTDGKLEQFPSVYEALQQFVDYRLGKYETRRIKQLELANDDMAFLTSKKTFITEWNNLANPGKMKTEAIEKHMIKAGVIEDYMPRLMAMRISSLTMDQIKELDAQLKKKKEHIKYLETTTAQSLYADDLETL